MPIASLRRAVVRFAADESANALTEYAIVLAVLSVGCMLYFEDVSTAATTRVGSDTAGFTNTAVSPP